MAKHGTTNITFETKPTSPEDSVDLYHYTTPEGLLGILNSGQLWATHPAYLNDSRELEYGLEGLIDLADSYVQEFEMKLHPSRTPNGLKSAQDRKALMRGALAFVRDNDKMKSFFRHDMAPFISCLSKARDQLSQWRGYSRGGGYAIRFNSSVLESRLLQVDPDGEAVPGASAVFLVPVSYDIDDCNSPLCDALDDYVEEMIALLPASGLPISIDEETRNTYGDPVIKLFSLIMLLISRVKSDKFKEEQEFRIYGGVEETFYSPSILGLIPRTAFRFNTEAVREIIVGPGEFSEMKKPSLERYLKRNRDRYPDVYISLSEIPYRDI